jgi:hypothetical protein
MAPTSILLASKSNHTAYTMPFMATLCSIKAFILTLLILLKKVEIFRAHPFQCPE